MEMFCPQGGKAEPQPLSVWCAQRLPSNEDSVCVCVCVCGGARGLEQLRSGEAWRWSSFAVEKPGTGAALQWRSLAETSSARAQGQY